MNNKIPEISGKQIVEANEFHDKNNELWRIQLVFADDTEFNIYLCENVNKYLDYDFDVPFN